MKKFSKKAQEFLKSIAHQPWRSTKYGRIRVLVPGEEAKRQHLRSDWDEDQVCPVCMWANIRDQKWLYTLQFWSVVNTGLSDHERRMIVQAADNRGHPYRAHLEKLLGMTK
jgi:hypothetical protein